VLACTFTGEEERRRESSLATMFFDYFIIALRNLLKRKLRSWLTMLGIFVGIIAVVSLISLGQGMQESINQQFETLGTNRIIITPGGVNFGPTTASLVTDTLTEDDFDEVMSVNGVENIMQVLAHSAKVEFKDEVSYPQVWGVSLDKAGLEVQEGVSFLEIESGRSFRSSDSGKAILGNIIAEDGFEKPVKVGNSIFIDDENFDVIGIQKYAGTGVHDVLIRIPLDDARDMWEEPEEISTLFVVTDPDLDTEMIAKDIESKLRKSRDVEEGEEDFQVASAQQSIEQLQGILGIVQVVLVGIAAVSLIVGGIGIMNTMFTSVLERRKEIGIMKSIGAKNSDVFLLFFMESGLLGVVGGIIGIVLGFGVSKIAEIVAIQLGASFFQSYFGLPLIIGALAFSFVVGSLSGTLPAIQASRLNPVDALRK
jgi:putative ABC transport system permease protein